MLAATDSEGAYNVLLLQVAPRRHLHTVGLLTDAAAQALSSVSSLDAQAWSQASAHGDGSADALSQALAKGNATAAAVAQAKAQGQGDSTAQAAGDASTQVSMTVVIMLSICSAEWFTYSSFFSIHCSTVLLQMPWQQGLLYTASGCQSISHAHATMINSTFLFLRMVLAGGQQHHCCSTGQCYCCWSELISSG